MQLPFSEDQFFDAFRSYNEAIWPLQFVLTGLAAVCILFLTKKNPRSHIVISGLLAFLWIWMAVVYHFAFFMRINPAALVFGLLFLVQGSLFLWFGTVKKSLRFGTPGLWKLSIGISLLTYGLMIYPVLNTLFGLAYLSSPTFGVPCPTTIFTIGLFFFLQQPLTWAILLVPLLWSVIGSTAAFLLHVPQDLGLLVSGLMLLLLFRRK